MSDKTQDQTIKDTDDIKPMKKKKNKKKKISELTEEELLTKVIEYRDLSQRLAADYQNLQKDTEKRMTEFRKYSNEQLVLELAPVLDYFNSAFAAVPEEELNSGWMLGIKHIKDHFIKVLNENNIEIIETSNQTFDPELHEAVSEEDSQLPEDTIIKETQAGFKLQGRVIKPAKVVVSKKTSSNSDVEIHSESEE